MAIEYLHHINLSDNQLKNVLLDNKTTALRDAMTAAAGHVIFNTTLSKFQFYDGSNWLNLQDELDESEVRAMISATDAGGDGSFAYNNATGVFTYTGPSAAEVRAHFSRYRYYNYQWCNMLPLSPNILMQMYKRIYQKVQEFL